MEQDQPESTGSDPLGEVLPVRGSSRDEIVRSVRTGEAQAIDAMTSSGALSASGPITDEDVNALVFMAVSTEEILNQLE